VPVWGELSTTVKIFMEKLSENMATTDQTHELAQRWKIWRTEKQKRLLEDYGNGISSIAVFDNLSKLISSDAVVCVDVGNNAYSLGRYFESRNQSFLMSGYLGSIGFAFPAALGAWAATKGNRQIVAVAGDGGFAQYMAEMVTSVKYGMNIKLILLNNAELGKITKEQRSGGFEKFATDLHNPDFAKFAIGCGALGIKVTRKEDLEVKMKEVLEYDGTALLEIMCDVNLI